MTEHEKRLRKTLTDVAERTHARSRIDRFPAERRRKVYGPAVAAAAFLMALVVLAVPLLVSTSPRLGVPGSQPPPPVSVTNAGEDPTDPGATDGSDDGGQVGTLLDVDVDVGNAVAPFDHHSNVDSLLLEFALARTRNQLVFDCIAAAGFTPPETTSLPERDDPHLYSAAFPDIEGLGRDGFPNLPGTPASPDDSETRTEEELLASRRCADEVDASDHEVSVAYELFASVRSAWEVVLAEIEATEEVRALISGFSSCLIAEGIPSRSASSEGAFLGYVDSLLMATGADDSTWPETRERMGKLYLECGRELLEARVQLRGGERREAFLSEHEETIRELIDLLHEPAAAAP